MCVCVCGVLVQEEDPKLFLCKLQRVRESERLREKSQKAKNQTPAAAANCEAASEGHQPTTARRPDRSASVLTPAAAAALSPSPHSVTTPDLLLVSDLVFFFFLFLSYFVQLFLSTACCLLALLVVTLSLTYFVSCLEFRQFSFRIIVFNIILFFIHLFDNLYFMFLVFTIYLSNCFYSDKLTDHW